MLLSDVSRSSRAVRLIGVGAAIALAAATVVLAGCASSANLGGTSPKVAMTPPPQATSGAVATASDVQSCAVCAKKGMGPKVVGSPVVQGGAQVLGVAFVNGYYAPNDFTVKAGTPVRVVFTGKAKGCLAKPTFKALGKSGDVTQSGSASIDLGVLKPGTYTWTCAMGMNSGTITVR